MNAYQKYLFMTKNAYQNVLAYKFQAMTRKALKRTRNYFKVWIHLTQCNWSSWRENLTTCYLLLLHHEVCINVKDEK